MLKALYKKSLKLAAPKDNIAATPPITLKSCGLDSRFPPVRLFICEAIIAHGIPIKILEPNIPPTARIIFVTNPKDTLELNQLNIASPRNHAKIIPFDDDVFMLSINGFGSCNFFMNKFYTKIFSVSVV